MLSEVHSFDPIRMRFACIEIEKKRSFPFKVPINPNGYESDVFLPCYFTVRTLPELLTGSVEASLRFVKSKRERAWQN